MASGYRFTGSELYAPRFKLSWHAFDHLIVETFGSVMLASRCVVTSIMAASELTLEQIYSFLKEKGGKVKNRDAVRYFKAYLTDPQTKGECV